MKPLLEVKDLSIGFRMYDRGFKQKNQQAITNLSFSIQKGEIIAVVGSSGSGKSLLAHGIMGLLPSNAVVSGVIKYDGMEITSQGIQKLRGKKMALIPQSVSYLDPLIRVGKQVQGMDRTAEGKGRQRSTFERVDLCKKSERLFPYQLSGGMARRVLVSTALQGEAELIIADEPTPGLDLGVAMKTLKYFREFADQGKAVLIITHDIDLALHVADKIAVFYAGTILEIAPVLDFKVGVGALRHPYTKALYKAMPQNGCQPIEGFQPYGVDVPSGCVFSPRCHRAKEICREKVSMRELRGGMVRCNHAT